MLNIVEQIIYNEPVLLLYWGKTPPTSGFPVNVSGCGVKPLSDAPEPQ